MAPPTLAEIPPMAAAVTALCLLPVAIAVYRLFLHPLSRIPGPKAGAVTTLWYAYQARRGRARELTQMLHDKYGPIVRVAPNIVWFNTEDAFREVYSENNRGVKDYGMLTVFKGLDLRLGSRTGTVRSPA